MKSFLTNFFVAVFLLLAILSVACSRTPREITAKIDKAKSLMQTRSDSSLYILEHINRRLIANKADSARYFLLLSEARNKQEFYTASDSILRFAFDYYLKKGSNHDKMLSHYLTANIYYDARHSDSTLYELKKAAYFSDIAKDSIYIVKINHLIGLLYQESLSYGKALEYFRKCKLQYRKLKDSLDYAIVSCNIADCMMYLDQQDSAINEYKEVLPYFSAHNQYSNQYISNKFKLASAYSYAGHINSAKYLFSELYRDYKDLFTTFHLAHFAFILAVTNSTDYDPEEIFAEARKKIKSSNNLLDYYEEIGRYYTYIGDDFNASKYKDSLFYLNNRLLLKTENNRISELDIKNDLEIEKQNASDKAFRLRLAVGAAIVLVICLILLSVRLIKKHKKAKSLELESASMSGHITDLNSRLLQLEEEKNQAMENLEHLKKEWESLSSMVEASAVQDDAKNPELQKEIDLLHQWLDSLMKSFSRMYVGFNGTATKPQSEQLAVSMIKDSISKMRDSFKTETFPLLVNIIDRVHDGMASELLRLFPAFSGQSATVYQIIICTLCNMNNGLIAWLLSLSESYVAKRKSGIQSKYIDQIPDPALRQKFTALWSTPK